MQKTIEKFKERFDKKISIEFFDKQNTNSVEVWQFWWYYEGMNIGNEISKDLPFKRVCLVLNNNIWNGLVFVAPITTKSKSWSQKYHVKIENYQKYWLKTPSIIINQIKIIDKKRISHKLSENKISKWFVSSIIKVFYDMIFLK